MELISVAVLVGNLLITKSEAIAPILGPLHGMIYLSVAATALLGEGLLRRTRLQALIPVLGGVFTIVNVNKEVARQGQ